MIARLPGSSLRRRLNTLLHRSESLFWERRLGIRTRVAQHLGQNDDEHYGYQPTAYRSIFRVLRRLDLRPSDVFVELGCGKGRVVCYAATQNVARVIGVEDIPEIAAIAEDNVRQLRVPHCPVSIVGGDVETFDFRQGSVFYMFNAFGRFGARAASATPVTQTSSSVAMGKPGSSSCSIASTGM